MNRPRVELADLRTMRDEIERRSFAFNRRPGERNNRGRIPIVTGGSAPVTPATIFGADLLQWVRSDQGVSAPGGFVSQWNDLSGNGLHYTQGVGIQQPAYNATGGPNSQPYIACDGTDDGLASSLNLPAPGTTPTFRWAVCRQQTWNAFDMLFGNFTNATPSFRLLSFPAVSPNVCQNPGNVNANASMAPATWFRVEQAYQNTIADWNKVGPDKQTGASAGNTAGDGTMNIALTNTGTNAEVWICELFYLKVIPSPAQLAALDTYCTNRYGAGLV